MRLIYVAIYTGRFDDMREFYERGLGLPARTTAPGWIAFDTAGAALALRRMDDPKRQGIMARFESDDLDATLAEFRERGLEPAGDIESFELGRAAELWDEDGNLISLLEPSTPAPSGAGPALSTLILNVTDMVAATTFYRDRFGLTALVQSTWWTEFDTGATRLSLHPRVSATDELRHNAQPIVVGLAAPNLDELQQELVGRGLDFSGGPVEQRYGRFAEVEDPDGNVVLFRESGPRHAPTPEEIAAAFEDDSPHQSAMRSPTRKTAHSVSRVAIKPAYKAKKPATNGNGAARPRRKVASVRGEGPEGTRRSPRRSNDPERVKLRPATGHMREAERRTLERKKRAVAKTSRTRPVKRAAANASRRSSKTGAKRAPRRGR
jgi:predicted enzyme related to lactoylglutathione lyase